MNEEEIISHLKDLITKGTDSFEQYVKDNPEKTSEILKAHYQLFLTEIMQGEIFEFEEQTMIPKGCYRDATERLYDDLTLCCNCTLKYNGRVCRDVRKMYNRSLSGYGCNLRIRHLKDVIIPETLEKMRAEGEYGRVMEHIVKQAIVGSNQITHVEAVDAINISALRLRAKREVLI